MSIQEILGKDPKRWKYKECTEILNGATTPEQKQTASDRQASIKAWVKSKEESEGNAFLREGDHKETFPFAE